MTGTSTQPQKLQPSLSASLQPHQLPSGLVQTVVLPAVRVAPAHDIAAEEARLKIADGWLNLIGWRVFGLVNLGLLVAQVGFGTAVGIPTWALLALTGAGFGGRQLAEVILTIFASVGSSASAIRDGTAGSGRKGRRS